MTPGPGTPEELSDLRAETAHLRRVNQELLGTVAELRATVEKQQAHIERLVRMTFGRRSERVTGPTLFGDIPDPDPPPAPEPPVPPTRRPNPRPRSAGATAGGPAAGAGGDRPDGGREGVPVLPGHAGPDRDRGVRAARLPAGVPVRPTDCAAELRVPRL